MTKRIGLFVVGLVLLLSLSSSALAQVEKKAAYAILIDNTGSLRPQFDLVQMIGKGIVREAHQSGPISLFSFETQGDKRNQLAAVTSRLEWSQDATLLNNHIENINIVPGQTALIDAIYLAAEQLNKKADSDKDAYREKIIFLITDGEDRTSKTKEKDLLQKLAQSSIRVYAVGLIMDVDDERGFIRQSSRQKATDLLEKITKQTGGRAVFKKSKRTDSETLLRELLGK